MPVSVESAYKLFGVGCTDSNIGFKHVITVRLHRGKVLGAHDSELCHCYRQIYASTSAVGSGSRIFTDFLIEHLFTDSLIELGADLSGGKVFRREKVYLACLSRILKEIGK